MKQANGSTRQVAVVTGAGSGIGLGCAVKLAEAGMAVVGVGRDPAKLKDLEKVFPDRDRLATLAVDLMDVNGPKRVVELAVQRFGHIDFLINNAGSGPIKALLETPALIFMSD